MICCVQDCEMQKTDYLLRLGHGGAACSAHHMNALGIPPYVQIEDFVMHQECSAACRIVRCRRRTT